MKIAPGEPRLGKPIQQPCVNKRSYSFQRIQRQGPPSVPVAVKDGYSGIITKEHLDLSLSPNPDFSKGAGASGPWI
jgi:hypothetical protein